jgi:hypothetical protein
MRLCRDACSSLKFATLEGEQSARTWKLSPAEPAVVVVWNLPFKSARWPSQFSLFEKEKEK